MKKSLLVLIILAVLTFDIFYNLPQFPENFYDQGTYIERAINLSKGSQVYQNPNYIDHPPLGWTILALIFKAIGYPDSIIHLSSLQSTQHTFESQILLILIPRTVISVSTIISAVLVYKLSLAFHADRNYAIMSLATFTTIPAMWIFRNFLLDPLMIMFVLFSLFLLTRKSLDILATNESTVNKYKIVLLISGVFFGLALVTKLTAVFFLPALLWFAIRNGNKGMYQNPTKVIVKQKQVIKDLCIWLVPVSIIIILWVAFMMSSNYLNAFISTQIWQIGRPSIISGLAIPFLLVASPLGVVFGIVGLKNALLSRDKLAWALLVLPYIAFLLRGGYVHPFYVIPLLPIFSIYAGKPCWQFSHKWMSVAFHRFNKSNKIMSYYLVAIIVLSVLFTLWMASFDASKAQRDAIQFLIDDLPPKAILVIDPGYGWLIKTFRPDVDVMEPNTLSYLDKIPDNFYIVNNPYPIQYQPFLKISQDMYEKSCIVGVFKNDPSYLHPYSLIPYKQWDVEIRHFMGHCK